MARTTASLPVKGKSVHHGLPPCERQEQQLLTSSACHRLFRTLQRGCGSSTWSVGPVHDLRGSARVALGPQERTINEKNRIDIRTTRQHDASRHTSSADQSRGLDSSPTFRACAEVLGRGPGGDTPGAQRPRLDSCRLDGFEDVAASGSPPQHALQTAGSVSEFPHSWWVARRPARSWRHAGVTSIVAAAAACNAGVRTPSALSACVYFTGAGRLATERGLLESDGVGVGRGHRQRDRWKQSAARLESGGHRQPSGRGTPAWTPHGIRARPTVATQSGAQS